MTDTMTSPSPQLGYELMRHFVLPDILGEESHSLLYLLGKNLGRKFTFSSIPELQAFFIEAGWGGLNVKSESKDAIVFRLEGEPVKKAFALNAEHSFNLEAGFLASNFTCITGCYTEAAEEISKQRVSITVKWDRKESSTIV